METLKFNYPYIQPNGAILDTWIAQYNPLNNEGTIFHTVQTLIDTGATYSVIDTEFVRLLGFQPLDRRENISFINGNPEKLVNDVYDLLFSFDSDKHKPMKVKPSGHDLSSLKYENGYIGFIIGRDILSKCILEYNGIEKHFTVTF